MSLPILATLKSTTMVAAVLVKHQPVRRFAHVLKSNPSPPPSPSSASRANGGRTPTQSTAFNRVAFSVDGTTQAPAAIPPPGAATEVTAETIAAASAALGITPSPASSMSTSTSSSPASGPVSASSARASSSPVELSQPQSQQSQPQKQQQQRPVSALLSAASAAGRLQHRVPLAVTLAAGVQWSSTSAVIADTSSSAPTAAVSTRTRPELPIDHLDALLAWKRDRRAFLGTSLAGFPQLGQFFGGIRPGELTLVSGPPGAGKSTWALTLALNLARQHGSRVLWSSVYTPNERIVARLLQQYSGMSLVVLAHEAELRLRLYELSKLPIVLAPKITTPNRIASSLDATIAKHPVDVVFVDGPDLAQADGPAILTGLRELAAQRQVHVACLVSQWSSLESSRNGMALYRAADNVLTMQRVEAATMAAGRQSKVDVIKTQLDEPCGSVVLEMSEAGGMFYEAGSRPTKSQSTTVPASSGKSAVSSSNSGTSTSTTSKKVSESSKPRAEKSARPSLPKRSESATVLTTSL
ncbi:P-loop containing nucleoside triphosphate hydrolase protein [Blastocladiella britannica]|nr:P-loop containing nucleoside triphosphate hydrolase protein [Blastocladiella britannica]